MSTLGTGSAIRWPASAAGRDLWSASLPRFGIIVGLTAAATAAVYATGGTAFSFVHLAYVPILVAAYFFGLPGGVAAGVVAGLAIGPLMPLDVAAGTDQTTINWVVRALLFAAVGAVAGVLSSRLRAQLEATRILGFRDPLTGLRNRAQLLEDVKPSADPPGQGDGYAVITIGLLESFFAIRSAFGDSFADQVRKEAARRLGQRLPREAALYDLGGGVFAARMPAGMPQLDAEMLGDRLVGTLTEGIVIDGVPIHVNVSAGLARTPQDGQGDRLVRASAAAFRDSVELGQPLVLFDDKNDRIRRDSLQLVGDFQSALRSTDQLHLTYQPKIHLPTGTCTGAEALIRWQHPKLGLLTPGRFIEAVERTALVQALTMEVLKLAVLQLKAWRADGFDMTVAVNVSTRNLLDEGFAAFVTDLLAEHDLPGPALQLEVTETSLMTAPGRANQSLQALRDLGVGIALDDFGTGHSSLAYLRDLAVDEVKLDRSFLQNLLIDQRARVVVESAIRTAHHLGLKVVAEGIEDGETYRFLRDAGCDLGQGFLLSKPLPPAELRAWLARSATAPLFAASA